MLLCRRELVWISEWYSLHRMVCARRVIEECQNLFQENLLGLGYVDRRLSRESILRLRNHLMDNFLLYIPSGRDKVNRKPKEDLNLSRAQLDELLRRQKIFFSYLTCTQKIEIYPSPVSLLTRQERSSGSELTTDYLS